MEIIGVVGSIANIVDVTAKCISVLQSLQRRWRAADLTVIALVSQLSVFRTALDQINQWIMLKPDTDCQHHQTTIDLDFTLNCCQDMIIFVNDYVSQLDWDQARGLTFRGKAKAVMDDGSMKQCIDFLNTQSVALNLLITALNRQTLLEQKELLERKGSRKIFDRVKDDSSSLIVLRDTASYSTRWTSNSTKKSSLLSKVFHFDHELQASGVYQANVRSLIRFRRAVGKNLRSSTKNSALYPCAMDQGTRHGARALESRGGSYHIKRERGEFANSVEEARPNHVQTLFQHGAKIPVLGNPGSGVATILEQMGLGGKQTRTHDDSEREAWKEIILLELASAFEGLIDKYLPTDGLRSWTQPLGEAQIEQLGCAVNSTIAIALRRLWYDGGLRVCRSQIDLDDYYWASIERIISPDYLPSDNDIVHGMWKMNGEHPHVTFRGWDYHFYHLPNFPKHMPWEKWWFEMSSPTGVFVVDLSAYRCEVNGIEPILTTLKTWLHQWDCSRHGSSKRVNPILVLNKVDLFKDRLGSDFLEAKTSLMNAVERLQDGKSKFARTFLVSATKDEDIGPALREAIADLLEGLVAETYGRDHPLESDGSTSVSRVILLYKQSLGRLHAAKQMRKVREITEGQGEAVYIAQWEGTQIAKPLGEDKGGIEVTRELEWSYDQLCEGAWTPT